MGKRVSVVEDDQELGDLLEHVLSSEGHDAVVARLVQQAIRARDARRLLLCSPDASALRR